MASTHLTEDQVVLALHTAGLPALSELGQATPQTLRRLFRNALGVLHPDRRDNKALPADLRAKKTELFKTPWVAQGSSSFLSFFFRFFLFRFSEFGWVQSRVPRDCESHNDGARGLLVQSLGIIGGFSSLQRHTSRSRANDASRAQRRWGQSRCVLI